MSSALRPVATPTTKVRMALLALTLLSTIGAAHAQSSYTLTKLSEPFLGKHDAVGFIDSQNRVTGTANYLSGFNLFGFGTGPGFTYTQFVARWSASTGTSIGPTKLINASNTFSHQSPDGSKVFVALNQRYYDTATRQFVTAPAPDANGLWEVKSINDGGAMAGTSHVYLDNPPSSKLRAVRWMPGAAAAEVLPIGSEYVASSSSFINQKGAVAGEVRLTGSDLNRAALWRESGAFEVLNTEADTHSRPLGMTESGDVLLWIENASTSKQRFAVVGNGVAKAIESPNPDDQVFPNAINADGVVVGTITQPSAPEGFQTQGFIWKDGVFTDLTAWVTAKGVKLPTGAVISSPWRVNAQGSILASMREANGKVTLVRLTAKP